LCTNIIAPAVTAYLDDQNVPAAYARKAWHFCIDCMRDRILWDEDFDINQNPDPEVAAYVNDYLGIEDEYYSEPMSDFTQDDFRSNLNYLLEVIKYVIQLKTLIIHERISWNRFSRRLVSVLVQER
jgi:hypothetical protein